MNDDIINELAEAGHNCAIHVRAEHYDSLYRFTKAYNAAVLAGVVTNQPEYKAFLLRDQEAKGVISS